MKRDLAALNPRRILVCQQRQIGDALLVTPALELLKRRFPQAGLHLFTEAKCEPLLRGNPHIDRFVLLNKRQLRGLWAQMAWYRRVAAAGYDLVVDFQQLPRCRMLTRFSRAGVRLSFPAPWHRFGLYTHTVRPEPGYAAAAKVSLLAPLGIAWRGERPRIYLTDDERARARALLAALGLREGQRLVSVDPTHRRASKRWPAARYAGLLDRLGEARPDLRFLLLRGPGEDDEVRALRAACARPQHILLPDGAPDLRLSAACMAEAALHLGNCSAPRHMAVALNVPSLVIPGASGPEWTYPDPRHVELRPGLPCAPCSRAACPQPRCLTLVSVDEAAEAALRLLDAPASPGAPREASGR
ncbi:MAG: glycosyltransferase family 9 protein [Desulfovibrionaceae bacterium]|nr:glycosyltransferase family 9 protein [Desulfovibrionaceae bacterium]